MCESTSSTSASSMKLDGTERGLMDDTCNCMKIL